jgi:hypothetical protein
MAKSVDKGEYDYEGDMAMSQLKSVMRNAQKIHDMLSPDTNLPEWVQSKITLAEDYITTAANYLQSEDVNESNNKPYVKPFMHTGSDKQAGWKASNKHGKLKFFGLEFKKSAEKHAGITTEDASGAPVNSTGPAVYGTNKGDAPPMFPKAIEKYKKSNQPLKRKSLEQFRKGN